MKTPRKSLITSLVVWICFLPHLLTGQRIQTIESTNYAGIKLSYIPTAKLNAVELHQVLSLARQSGITNVESVSTVYGIPGPSRHVIVKSKERVDGRNVSYDTLSMDRKSWESGEKSGGILDPIDFKVEKSGKQAHFERSYELAGKLRRVAMSEKDVAVADKVIPLIAAKKVRFENEANNTLFNSTRHEFEQIDLSKPDVLSNGRSTEEYDLNFSESQQIISFRYKDGEVLIISIGMYHI